MGNQQSIVCIGFDAWVHKCAKRCWRNEQSTHTVNIERIHPVRNECPTFNVHRASISPVRSVSSPLIHAAWNVPLGPVWISQPLQCADDFIAHWLWDNENNGRQFAQCIQHTVGASPPAPLWFSQSMCAMSPDSREIIGACQLSTINCVRLGTGDNRQPYCMHLSPPTVQLHEECTRHIIDTLRTVETCLHSTAFVSILPSNRSWTLSTIALGRTNHDFTLFERYGGRSQWANRKVNVHAQHEKDTFPVNLTTSNSHKLTFSPFRLANQVRQVASLQEAPKCYK